LKRVWRSGTCVASFPSPSYYWVGRWEQIVRWDDVPPHLADDEAQPLQPVSWVESIVVRVTLVFPLRTDRVIQREEGWRVSYPRVFAAKSSTVIGTASSEGYRWFGAARLICLRVCYCLRPCYTLWFILSWPCWRSKERGKRYWGSHHRVAVMIGVGGGVWSRFIICKLRFQKSVIWQMIRSCYILCVLYDSSIFYLM